MNVIPYLHVSMPDVEKLADFPVPLLPIDSLTGPGTIHGGLALIAVLEQDIRRCFDATDDTFKFNSKINSVTLRNSLLPRRL